MIGTVVSISNKYTAIVEVTRAWRHPVYKKSIRRSRRIPVHIEGTEVVVGARVRLVATRPISKTKHYKISQKL